MGPLHRRHMLHQRGHPARHVGGCIGNAVWRTIDASPVCRRQLDVHLVMDDYAAHKTHLIRDWLAKRPRWHVH